MTSPQLAAHDGKQLEDHLRIANRDLAVISGLPETISQSSKVLQPALTRRP
ncbi:MAG: hypothetical protein ABJQ29_02830 [Luteolibacter sp.]